MKKGKREIAELLSTAKQLITEAEIHERAAFNKMFIAEKCIKKALELQGVKRGK